MVVTVVQQYESVPLSTTRKNGSNGNFVCHVHFTRIFLKRKNSSSGGGETGQPRA